MLASNDLLVQIVSELGQRVYSVDEAFKKLEQSARKTFSTSELLGEIGEVSFQIALEEIVKDYGERVDLNPIADRSRTDHYFFHRDSAGRMVVYLGSGNHSEIDSIAVVDGLPVLFEIKMATKRRAKSNQANFGSRKINHQISTEGVYRRIHPVQEYFDTFDCGMVFVTLPENLKHTSEAQVEFKKNGGFLIPLYTDGEFRKEVEFYAKRYGVVENNTVRLNTVRR